MKIILKCFLIQLVLLPSTRVFAQVGIGTTTPDVSSILDVSSTSKGLLMPRLNTTERDNILLPATGLMIYNTSSNDVQLNIGTPSVPSWIGIKRPTTIKSVTAGDYISTTSTSDVLVPGMTVSPEPGTYVVSFKAQISSNKLFGSAGGVIDMDRIYRALTAMPGGVPHGPIFGAGEVLSPGVYDVAGASSIAAGTLTMDGGGDPNSVFIIRSTGAFTTATTTNVVLTNGASSNNIFWMSEVALSVAAGAIIKGALVSSAGAITLGENTNLEGRMLTKDGALTIVAGSVVTAPSGLSPIHLGVLSTFAMWSSIGAVSDDATSMITGDVGTATGALTIIGMHTGVQYPAGTIAPPTPTIITTYSIYLNGVEVVNSSRTFYSEKSLVSLQAKVTTLTAGETIEVRWKVDTGDALLNNRILSLIHPGY
ncbi:ice-binding family protein [Patiriisocius sp. Uisw_017]|jgi:hypothetical protein|uniref:ice-binding family protein n=1 Tax=Patiriisocius sp. Uisw_017 TaxID=3230968 RepID=UPI0039E7C370